MDEKEIKMITQLLEAIKSDSTDTADQLMRKILKHKSSNTKGE